MKNNFGTPFSATATGTTSAVATITGVAAQTIYLTDVSGSSDLAGSTITIASGGTTIWKDIVGAGSYKMNYITPIKVATGASATITLTGTSVCYANVSGFVLNNS